MSTTALAAGEALEEVVVTATRREESISKVPLSIVANNQETLDRMGVRTADDLARITPSISFGQGGEYYGTGQTQIAIRGVTSTSGVPTTGVYIDDTPIQSRTGVSPSLTNVYPKIFDLDRVEVLRGPQGTLFGTGSMGGAVRFITPDPISGAASLYARAEYNTTKHGAPGYEAGIAGGTPLADGSLGVRASFWHQDEGGYLDRLDRVTRQLTHSDINRETSNVGRVAIGWKPLENLIITPSVFFQDVDIADTSLLELATSDMSRTDYRNSLYITPQPHHDRFWLPALNIKATLGNISLISNTSYFTRHTSTVSDDTSLNVAIWGAYSGSSIPPEFAGNRANTQNWTSQSGITQEIRLQGNSAGERFKWIAGAFYSNSVIHDAFDAANADLLQMVNYGALAGGDPNAPYASLTDVLGTELYQGKFVVSQRSRYHDLQKSVFAQADVAVGPRVKLTAGVRYTDASLDYENFLAGPLYGTDVGTLTKFNPTTKSTTPKFGVSFQANDDNLFYANVAKGVRGGTVADPVGSNCSVEAAALGIDTAKPRNIDSDSLWSYEVGSKNRLLSGRLAIDAAVYREKWSNIQTNVLLPQCQVLTTLSLGNATIDGFDVSVMAVPVNGLRVGAAVSRMDARYTSELGIGQFVVHSKGEPLKVAPWMYTFNAEYEAALNDSYKAYAHADYAHSTHDSTPLDTASFLTDPDIPRAPANSSLDLRVGVRIGRLDISLFGNNILNDHPLLSLGHDNVGSGFLRTTTLRPRTIGITATYRR